MASVVDGQSHFDGKVTTDLARATEIASSCDISACFDEEHGTIRIGPKDSRHYRNLSDYTITEDDTIAENVFGYVPLSGRKQKNVLACLHACYALNRDGDGPNVRSSQPRITITLKPFY